MSSPGQAPVIHVRFRGNVFGPYTPEELRDLVRRGKTSSTWEISLDRQNWRPIRELDALLRTTHSPDSLNDDGLVHVEEVSKVGHSSADDAVKTSPGSLAIPETASEASDTEEALWYYAEDDQQVGPIPESRMLMLAQQGRINSRTLVWTLNMESWRPLGETRLARAIKHKESLPRVEAWPTPGQTKLPSAPQLSVLSDRREQFNVAFTALAVVAGVALVFKLILLPFGPGGLVTVAEFAECSVLALLLVLALLGRTILRELFPEKSEIPEPPSESGQDDPFSLPLP